MTARPGWGDRRQCLRSSDDLKSWTNPELRFQPDPLDIDGPVGMYGLPVHIYSEANRGAHGRERSEQNKTEQPLSSLMLHRLRKDGWMYLSSKGDWAVFQTKPFSLRSPTIKTNAAANYGEVWHQLTDEKSQPIEGYSFEDCVPLQGEDSLCFELRWKKGANRKTIVNRPLRLEVKFRQANIYSFEMDHHFLDAHDMWLLKDGKPLPKIRGLIFE
ncbi:MAG: hypothetical protein P1V20_22155 [Verrucomicrobiales bacterium]|nr:hypothetical protein [Verrucomicrobiales bacterium]